MKLVRHALVLALASSLTIGSVFAADRAKAEKELTNAIKELRTAGPNDREKIYDKVRQNCEELVEDNSKEALTVLVNLASKEDDKVLYYQLTGSAAGFQGQIPLSALGEAIMAHKSERNGLSRDLLFRLQNNTSNYVVVPLSMVLEKGPYDLQLMCADQLAQVRTVDSVDTLIVALRREEKGDPQLRQRIAASLTFIMNEDKGDITNWEGWWKEQKAKGVPERKQTGEGVTGPRDRERENLKKQQPKRVIVLASESPQSKPEPYDQDYDEMQKILSKHNFPHQVVKRADFSKDPDKYLKECFALLINCHQIGYQCVCPTCHQGGGSASLTNRLGRCPDSCKVHNSVTYALPQNALDRIKGWVENQGGFLYTEDWGLIETLEVLWPEKVGCPHKDDANTRVAAEGNKSIPLRTYGLARKISGNTAEKHMIVKLSPGKGNTSNPLMRGVWLRPKKKTEEQPKEGGSGEGSGSTGERPTSVASPLEHQWNVDDESPMIEIKDQQNVTILLEAADLAQFVPKDFPQLATQNAVAITFRVGRGEPKDPPKERVETGPGGGGTSRATGDWSPRSKGGRVLHTMSHYGHQDTSEDGQALENMLLNFLLEAGKRHGPDK